MNIKRFLILLFFSIIFLSFETTAKAEKCHRNADGNIVVDDESADGTDVVSHDGTTWNKDYCNEVPLFYKVKIYEAMFCSSDPYVDGSGDTGADPDLTSCTKFFTNAAGKELIIQPNSKSDLFDGNIALPIGSFPYSVLMVDNELGIKHYETYVDTGGEDADINGHHTVADNTAFSNGKTCYTHNKTTSFTGKNDATIHGKTIISTDPAKRNALGLVCTDSFDPNNPPSDYDYTTEIIDSIDGTCDASNDCDTTFRPYIGYQDSSLVFGRYAGVLVQNDLQTVGSNRNNSTRIAYIINFDTPVIIDEDVTGFEMLFSTSESVSIDWGAANDVTSAVKLGADPFQVRYNFTR
ncbi:MAG: hypothetical protein CBE49_002455 [Rickettsiales bacterium TMED289]|nr:MAG: hypothetical protein CBE49_002455 [Rickettsiales bacterium TMED289]